MKIFTPVWGGDKYVNLFDQALATCLAWPKNNAAIATSHWYIPTDTPETGHKVAAIIQKKIDPGAQIDILVCPDLVREAVDKGMVLIEPLRMVVQACLDAKEPMLMATPDFIFGEGTISAFQKIGADPGSCVSIAHMRVLPALMSRISTATPLSGAQLMNLANSFAHPAWYNCEKQRNPGMTYIGGISWQWIEPRLAAVRHFLPSPFYVNFIPKDLEAFNKNWNNKPPAFGLWDHVWAAELIQDGRLRYIGSSDAASMIEVTDELANVPPWNPPGVTNDRPYYRNEYQNHIQKQFSYIMRGE